MQEKRTFVYIFICSRWTLVWIWLREVVTAFRQASPKETSGTRPCPRLKNWWADKTGWKITFFVQENTFFQYQVGYPTSLLSVRALLDNDFANIAVSFDKASLIGFHQELMKVHLRKLIGSDHPVLRTAKRLIYHGKNKMQARSFLLCGNMTWWQRQSQRTVKWLF